MLTQDSPSQALQTSTRRILVLGSLLKTPTATSFLWNDLPPTLAIANYDTVILNLASFLHQQNEGEICPERLPTWQQLARLLFSRNSEIICIGLPPVDAANSLYQSLAWWLPVMPECVLEPGDTIQQVKPEFAFYFDHVKRWFFHVAPQFKPHFLGLSRYLKQVHPHAANLQAGMGAIARNRSGQAIAFKLMFRATAAERFLPSQKYAEDKPAPQIQSGDVIWLPPPTEITPDEAIHLILRERYGVTSTQTAPAWMKHYTLPQQQSLESQIQLKQQDIHRLQQEVVLLQRQFQTLSSQNRLLYESSADRLAEVVCDALRSLGATLGSSETNTPGAVQFVAPDGQEGITVIRSVSTAIAIDDLRLLDQWTRDLLMHQDWRGKGLLIANSEYHKPPTRRGQPFASNVIRAAQHFGYGLVTTTQLYFAIAAHQRGNLDLEQFWRLLLNGSGVCALPEKE